MPAVVLEIVAGVVLGPSVLGWVEADLPVSIVAVLGLAFLLFLAGLEIDVHRLRGTRAPAGAASATSSRWRSGSPSAAGSTCSAGSDSPVLIAVALSATSLGLVVPVLKDAGRLDGVLGQTVVAAASVADFAAIVLLSLFFSTSESGTGTRVALLALFAALVALTAVAALAVARSMTPLGGGDPAAGHHRRDPGPGRGAAARRLRRAGRQARVWRRSSAPSSPAPWSVWSTRTPPRTRTSAPSSRRSATGS